MLGFPGGPESHWKRSAKPSMRTNRRRGWLLLFRVRLGRGEAFTVTAQQETSYFGDFLLKFLELASDSYRDSIMTQRRRRLSGSFSHWHLLGPRVADQTLDEHAEGSAGRGWCSGVVVQDEHGVGRFIIEEIDQQLHPS